MGHKFTFIPDDEPNDIVRRYEDFLLNRKKVSGYFDVEELENIIDYYLHRGRTRESAEAVEFGFKIHPNSSVLLTKRAKNFLAIGEIHKAYRILDSLPEKDDYEVQLLRIEALMRMDRKKEATVLCDRLCKNEHSRLDTACMDIATVMTSLPEPEIALTYLTKGHEFNPKSLEILFEMAFCNEQLFEFEDALENYRKITRIDSFSIEAWFNMGQLYMGISEHNKAISCFDYAQAIKPDDSLTYLQKAHCFFQLQQYRDALNEYKEYTRLTSETWQTHLFIGECYERLDLYNEAILWYHKSLEIKADNYEALTGIAICLLEKEHFVASLDFLKKAIELKPEAADVWVYLGEALTGTDEIDGALVSYLKAIDIDPEQPDTLMAIANIFLEKGEYELAIQYYEQADGFDYENELENIHLFLAIAHDKLGHFEESISELEIAAGLNPEAISLFREIARAD